MNMQKFTQKSIETISEAQELAIKNQNMQIEQEHLLRFFNQSTSRFYSRIIYKNEYKH